jgi:hypothetical protein
MATERRFLGNKLAYLVSKGCAAGSKSPQAQWIPVIVKLKSTTPNGLPPPNSHDSCHIAADEAACVRIEEIPA